MIKTASVLLLALACSIPAQMEKRERVLYDREAFRARVPAVGKPLPELVLKGLDAKTVKLSRLRSKPLIVIGGAYT